MSNAAQLDKQAQPGVPEPRRLRVGRYNEGLAYEFNGSCHSNGELKEPCALVFDLGP